MENPFVSPNSSVELKRPKVLRPKIIYPISILFCFFIVADTILAYLGDVEGEWIIVAGLSAFLLFVPWGIFVGKTWAPKTGVTVAIIYAILNLTGLYEESVKYPILQMNIYIVEGICYLIMAFLLYRLKDHGFFQNSLKLF